MPQARSLRDLLLIREHNRSYIDGLSGINGSALGFKNRDGSTPAILLFVDRKIPQKWLRSGRAIRPELRGPGNLRCPTDVIESSYTAFDRNMDARLLDIDTDGDPRVIKPEELLGLPSMNSAAKYELLTRLRGQTDAISPGSALSYSDEFDNLYSGTLACFARNAAGDLGLLTNKHVGLFVGNELRFPDDAGITLAEVEAVVDTIPTSERFLGVLTNPKGSFAVDGGFARLDASVSPGDLDFQLPILDGNGAIVAQRLGAPRALDLDTMGPVGDPVIGVGQMRSFQRGEIFAFSYQFGSALEGSIDYLVLGNEEGDEFSHPGDSGKLIVTDDGRYQPVAILWGGWYERLRHVRRQENWSYASDINLILDKLSVSVASS